MYRVHQDSQLGRNQGYGWLGIQYWLCDLAKKGNTKKGNYDGLDKQATWMGMGRLDKEGMIRLDEEVMGITKKRNFDGLYNILKKKRA